MKKGLVRMLTGPFLMKKSRAGKPRSRALENSRTSTASRKKERMLSHPTPHPPSPTVPLPPRGKAFFATIFRGDEVRKKQNLHRVQGKNGPSGTLTPYDLIPTQLRGDEVIKKSDLHRGQEKTDAFASYPSSTVSDGPPSPKGEGISAMMRL
jgi:hypothetical protein